MFDRLALLVRDWAKPLERHRQLSVANLVHLFSELSNYRHRGESSDPFPVFLRFFGDNATRSRKIFFATPKVGSGSGLQVIEVVQEDVVELADVSIYIARESNIEDAQRSISARAN